MDSELEEFLITLHEQAVQTTLAACCVPAVLALGRADGTMLRESWRQFLFGSVAPMARLIAAELSAKLETEVSLEFGELRASDLTGRARAFGTLRQNGVSIESAARICGLDEAEEDPSPAQERKTPSIYDDPEFREALNALQD